MNNEVLNNSLYIDYSMDDLLNDLETWEKEKETYTFDDLCEWNETHIKDLERAVISSIRGAYNRGKITYDKCFLDANLLIDSYYATLVKRKVYKKTAGMEFVVIACLLDDFKHSAYDNLRVALEEDRLD